MSEPEAPTPPAERNPYAAPPPSGQQPVPPPHTQQQPASPPSAQQPHSQQPVPHAQQPAPHAQQQPYGRQPAPSGQQPPPSYAEHRATAAHQPPRYVYADPQYGPPNPWPVTPPPERKPGTNGMAIAALVFGIIGGIPLAIVFGVIALGQTANGRQQGRGLAIAGLVCAGLWVTGLVTAGVFAAFGGPDRDDAGRITEEGSLSAYDVEVGDCVNGVRDIEAETHVRSLPAVPCTEPHEGEVYAAFDLTGDAKLDSDAVIAQAEQRCADALYTYSTHAYDDPNVGIFYLYPDERAWPRDRSVVCIAVAIEGTLTGSLAERTGT